MLEWFSAPWVAAWALFADKPWGVYAPLTVAALVWLLPRRRARLASLSTLDADPSSTRAIERHL